MSLNPPLSNDEYDDIHRRLMLSRYKNDNKSIGFRDKERLRNVCDVSEAELAEYNKQKAFDRQKYPFFSCFISERQKEILHLFELWDTIIVKGGNRSTKTNLLCFFIVCMASGYWPVGYKKYKTKDGMFILRPIFERSPKRMPLPHPSVAWISCLDRNMQVAPRGVQDTLEAMIPAPWIKHIRRTNQIYTHTIYLADGSLIQFKTAESGPQKYQSASLDAIALDEAHDENIWDELRSRTGKRIPKTFYAYYPRYGRDWAFKKFYKTESQPEKTGIVATQMSFIDNPFLPKKVKDEQLRRWGDDKMAQARIYGDDVELMGLVYKNFDRAKNVKDHLEIKEFEKGKPPKDWYHFMAIDSHNSEKGCAAIFGACSPTGRRYYWHEYQSSPTASPSIWCDDIATFINENELVIEDCWVDPSAKAKDANGFIIFELFEDRLPVESIQIAKRDRVDGILAVSEGFAALRYANGTIIDGEPGIVISSFCVQSILQIELYTNKDNVLGHTNKKDDEYCDVIRYCEIEVPAETARLNVNSEFSSDDYTGSSNLTHSEQSAAQQTI